MSDDKPRLGPAAPPGAPPRLDRVPSGYRPPPLRPAAPAPPAAPAVAPSGPVTAPAGAASYGIAAREVGADAAIAAGIAHGGSLAKDGALRLFALAAASRATGRLSIAGEGCSFALVFRRGTVEHAASADPGDAVGPFLLRRGALSADALARAERAGGDLVTAIVAAGMVNPADVAGLLQEHGAHVVQRALSVAAGTWSWNPQAAPPPGAFPLGPPFGMLCAAVRSLDRAALLERLGERERQVASRVAGRMGIEELRLTPQEARIAGLFDGSRTPGEIASSSPSDALAVLRVALLLGELELLRFSPRREAAAPARPTGPERPGAAPTAPPAPRASSAPTATAPARAPATPPPATPPPAAPPASAPPAARGAARPGDAGAPGPARAPARTGAPAARPGSPVPMAAPAAAQAPATGGPVPHVPAAARGAAPASPHDVAALEALRARLQGADHFAVLGVKQEATAAQIKAAYFQLARSYHPDAVPADVSPEARRLCAEVFAKVSEAWSVLGDDASRASYLEALRAGGTDKVDVMAILRAESVFQAGTQLVKARRYDEAVQKFDEAMALNGEEAEFGMWKAWCEFLLADDRKKQLGPASSAIEAGLKRNPRCAQGYLFLGQMAKLAGDLALAERQLKRGLQVAPEHAELQRELKYLRR